MGSTRAPGGRRSEQEIVLEEAQGQNKVTPEDVNRMRELLAAWALRRGQKVLKKAGLNPNNDVTGSGIKGYGAAHGSN